MFEIFFHFSATMIWFLCFSTPPANRSKKVVQHCVGTLHEDYPNMSQDQTIKLATGTENSNSKFDKNNSSSNSVENIKFSEKGSGFSVDTNCGFPFDCLDVWNVNRISDPFDNNDSTEFYHNENEESKTGNQKQENNLIKSEVNDTEVKKSYQQESSNKNWDELLAQKEFSMRRVEHWISQINMHDDLIAEEPGECSTSVSKEDSHDLIGVPSPKPHARCSHAKVVAYNNISSLPASSSSSQMANLGLITVPILSAFISLKTLNLSGNAIVQVTAESLPKSLHMLNFSRNNISTIEGLRQLTRLRVLDLSYNRIARIGHGLASCTSLKQLYLAGNKISEVDGLHRLLKLNILDLGFNKISTAKSLGNLVANYSALQEINLEGNPAQRNEGDEQLKKFLLGLLTNLVYYNKQAIRVGSKEASNRTSTQAVAATQFF